MTASSSRSFVATVPRWPNLLLLLPLVFLNLTPAWAQSTFDGVVFTADEETQALAILNGATRTQLQYPGGFSADIQATIQSGRTWTDLETFSTSAGIETSTLEALLSYAQRTDYFAWTGGAHDLNNATAEELDEVNYIGPATAESILAHRTNFNFLEHEDQLVAVGSIGISEVDGMMASDPRIYVSPWTGQDYMEAVDGYSSPYRRTHPSVSVSEVAANLDAYEDRVLRFEQAAVTNISDELNAVTFYIGDWGEASLFEPAALTELKVYLPERSNTRLLDPYNTWDPDDGEPYDRANFYRNWEDLSSGRITVNHVYAIEGVLVNDPTYGWELVVRPEYYAGEDRIVLIDQWLEAEDWLEFHAWYDKPHIGAKVMPTYSSGWTVALPDRLVYAHPCIEYALSQGDAPPDGYVYYPFDATQTAYVQWFETWLQAWKEAGAPTITGAVVINEVVKDPQTDWSTTQWDGQDGENSITDTDEYVELFNASNVSVNLTGYQLLMQDSSSALETFTTDASNLFVSSGSRLDALLPGGFLWVGNPDGAMNNDATIQLLTSTGLELDRLSLDGNASSPSDEALYRCSDGVDTDSDGDWCRGPGTPGAANAADAVCADEDGDGFADVACGGEDCDDGDSSTYPGALEVCDDGMDNNCDGLVDDVETCGGPGCEIQRIYHGGGGSMRLFLLLGLAIGFLRRRISGTVSLEG